jgi:hypothetical protein
MTSLPDPLLPDFLGLMARLSRMAPLSLLLVCRVSMILGLEVLRLMLGAFGFLGHDFSNSTDVPRIFRERQQR